MRVSSNELEVTLEDGRRVAVPLSFYPTLQRATPAQRRRWILLGGGYAVAWDNLNLDLSVESIVAGRREHIPPPGFWDRLRKTQREAGMEEPPRRAR